MSHVVRPERGGSPHAESPDSPSFESYFRDPDFPPSQPLAWALGHRTALLDALRGLFHGPAAMAQLRLWCFMKLCSQPQARLSREDIQQLFHAVWPEALEISRTFIGQGLGGVDSPVSLAMPETVQQGYAPVIPIHRPVEMPA